MVQYSVHVVSAAMHCCGLGALRFMENGVGNLAGQCSVILENWGIYSSLIERSYPWHYADILMSYSSKVIWV